ncbi:hypothetical protein HYPSUDRAFT_44911 [Hypholoma sublateritium FD-334 SS-4]|uniref:Uncharacterized protein n=1 Tax=Hypholoma sublateritium (strain FD-334 SS-4) TaxID=945553 RepID=A0A0D2NIN4_HYPSF|nr:hypothetical protein HYPSUDRAFT_44911 [Hypholoma sublateritium FD-334 SS-4]
MSANYTSAMLKTAALRLPTPIYEDARTLFDKYEKFLEQNDGGQEAYIFDDFFESADTIIASDAYKKLAKPDQSVHKNIVALLRSRPAQNHAGLPLARYLKSAAVVVNTKGYRKANVKLHNAKQHCVRCHETYTEGDGERCRIPHVMNEEYDYRVYENRETRYSSECCGSAFSIKGDRDGCYDDSKLQKEENLCVNLLHTASVSEVERSRKNYNGVNILRCKIVDGKCTPSVYDTGSDEDN